MYIYKRTYLWKERLGLGLAVWLCASGPSHIKSAGVGEGARFRLHKQNPNFTYYIILTRKGVQIYLGENCAGAWGRRNEREKEMFDCNN
jgi:hypothetical protein